MHATDSRLALAAIIYLSMASAHAANDEANFIGDKLSFKLNVNGKLQGSTDNVCIPAETSLRGMTKYSDTQPLGVVVATFSSNPKDCVGGELPKGKVIEIQKSVVDSSGLDRFGLTYGGLVVPFKYDLGGAKEFRSGGTIAPYLGYRFDRNYLGVGLKLVGFLGGSGVPVEQTVDGQKKTQTLAGLSYGIGAIGTVKGDFQVGFVLGSDRVSKSANYANNGKWWGALAVGFSFTE